MTTNSLDAHASPSAAAQGGLLQLFNALPFPDFDSAALAVLELLRERLGFDAWLITRRAEQQQIVLHALDRHYGLRAGVALPWDDGLCSQMTLGNGPCVAPDVQQVPGYRSAPILQRLEIGAYIGVPLADADGTVIGTLCALDRQPQPGQIAAEVPLVELLARMLSTVLNSELAREAAARRSERLAIEAQTDALSGLYNRRAWDRLIANEDERCRRHGHTATLIAVDLDGLKHVNDTLGHPAGDRLIERAGKALRTAAREIDSVARIGGDEFGVLGVECDAAGARTLADRVRNALEAAGVDASIGVAVREPHSGLRAAWQLADRRMYEEKTQRRLQREPTAVPASREQSP